MKTLKDKALEITIVTILLLMTLFCFALYFLTYQNPEFQVLSYLSGISSFVVAILTTIYVYTTLSQFKVMRRQLDEMKKDRELQHQPFLWIKGMELICEAPRFFYSPPYDEYSIQCRYISKIAIKNIGTHPSISNDISAEIYLIDDESKSRYFSTDCRINVIEEKEVLDSDRLRSFLFVGDNDSLVLKALVDGKKVFLKTTLLYRNTIGACFKTSIVYAIYITDKEREIAKSYLEILSSSSIRYSDEIKELRKIRKIDKIKWKEKFEICEDDVKTRIYQGVKNVLGNDFNNDNNTKTEEEESEEINQYELKFKYHMIPDSLNTITLTMEEYDSLQEKLSYGAPAELVRSSCKK